jgi:amidohydrolase
VTDRVVPSPTASPGSLAELRRDIHRMPELRFQEHRTAGLIQRRLENSGYTVRAGVGRTGLVAATIAKQDRPHILIRADMDAIQIADLKDASYASSVPGIAHACGHDVHSVVVLGVAERIALEPLTRGRISFVFQPAEERPFGEPSGARAMIETGFLDESPVDAVLGLHCWPDLPAGTIGIDERISMASKDAFRVRLIGRAAHAAAPSRGRDAILGIAQLVTTLHQGFSRCLDPGDLAVLNIGTVHGGLSQSVVAAEAEVTGTLRTVEPALRARLRAEIERIARFSATMLALESEFTWSDEMPSIVNDARLVADARDVIEGLIGPERTQLLRIPPMTSDDFALFAEMAPALYLKLGVCGSGACAPLHSGGFDIDERAIDVGVAVLEGVARRLVDVSPELWGHR